MTRFLSNKSAPCCYWVVMVTSTDATKREVRFSKDCEKVIEDVYAPRMEDIYDVLDDFTEDEIADIDRLYREGLPTPTLPLRRIPE